MALVFGGTDLIHASKVQHRACLSCLILHQEYFRVAYLTEASSALHYLQHVQLSRSTDASLGLNFSFWCFSASQLRAVVLAQALASPCHLHVHPHLTSSLLRICAVCLKFLEFVFLQVFFRDVAQVLLPITRHAVLIAFLITSRFRQKLARPALQAVHPWFRFAAR
jgi:hypothetical protein